MTAKLSALDVEWIRLYAAETLATPRLLAEEYGVHHSTVRDVLRGKTHQGLQRAGRKDRKLTVREVRRMRKLAAQGHREHAIKKLMKSPYSRSTIRQVIDFESYRDIV